MPNYFDLFPNNYGVTSSPLDTLSVDPMQFVSDAVSPWGGSPGNPLGDTPLLSIFVTGLDSGINLFNQVLSSVLGTNIVLIPNVTQLINLLEGCLTPGGLVTGFLSGTPLVSLLFGGGGSSTGLFGTSSLFGSGGLFSGFLSGVPILGQLTSALGGIGTDIGAFVHGLENLPKDIATIFGAIPVGQLSTTQPNLLISPIFTPDSVAPDPEWTVDTSTTRSADGSGSLMVTANGRPKALRSGKDPADTIKVGVGQNLSLSLFAISSGAVTGTGGPAVLLQVQPFATDGTPLVPVTVASWIPSADTDWPQAQQMIGTYAVPAGVSDVQARLVLTEQAVQGVYHFDDGYLCQVADMNVIPGLAGTLQTLDSARRALMDTLASALRGIPMVGTVLSDITIAVENFNPFNILGSLGSVNATGDLFGIIGSIIDAVKGQPHGTTTDASLAQLYAAMNSKLNNNAGSDETHFYDTTTVVPINSWCNQIDVLGVGKGQNGENGALLDFDGQGGNAGKVNMTTWLRGTHFDAGTGNVTVTINSDGSVTISIPAGTSTSAHSITCAIGTGTQSTHFGTGYMGVGNQPVTYNGKPYALGGNQNTPGAAGLGPGGGGAGGGGIVTFFQPGGVGAPGGGYVRQIDTVTGTSTGADTSAPTGGTGSLVGTSVTSITVTAHGATDA